METFVGHQARQRHRLAELLQPTDPNQIDSEALVATGMLALADFVPGDVDKEQMIADYVNDQIDVVGRGVMGLTLAWLTIDTSLPSSAATSSKAARSCGSRGRI